MDVAQNIASIKKHIQEMEALYHRQPGSVFLLAASKKQSIEKMQQALLAGQYAFGENYAQEALSKMAILTDKRIEWHFIGSIQHNKTKKIAEHFSWVHSVSKKEIAERLNTQRPPHLPPLNICLEVNISHEKTKSGVLDTDLLSLAEFCLTLPHIRLRGLMAIPAPRTEWLEQRAELSKLRLLFEALIKKNLPLDTLSMGMSHDMDAAIAEGTTMVRIGTTIFGTRE